MPLAMKPIIPLLISVLTGTALTSPALGQSSDLPQSSEQTAPPIHPGTTTAPPPIRPYPPASIEPRTPPSPPVETETVTLDPNKPFNRYFLIKGYPKIPPVDFDLTGPPLASDQKLIDWKRPPILDYEIPAPWQGMKIACGEKSQNMLDEAVATCAPLLEMSKLSVQLEYAATDPISPYGKSPARAEASRREALAFANKIITTYAAPEWPLQYKILSNAYRIRSELYKEWNKFDAAIADQDARILLLHGPDKYGSTTSTYEGDFTSSTDAANAYWKKGELLLAQKDRAAALKNYDAAMAALNPKDMFVLLSPVRYHTEMMVKDAIMARDYDKALLWSDRYLARYKELAPDYGASANFSGETSLQKLLAYKLYAHASKGDQSATLDTLALYEKTKENESRHRPSSCHNQGLFIQIAAPYKDPATRARLKDFACDIMVRQTLGDL